MFLCGGFCELHVFYEEISVNCILQILLTEVQESGVHKIRNASRIGIEVSPYRLRNHNQSKHVVLVCITCSVTYHNNHHNHFFVLSSSSTSSLSSPISCCRLPLQRHRD